MTLQPPGRSAPKPRLAARRWALGAILSAGVLTGCGRNTPEKTIAAADSTRTVRARIAFLEAHRSFGDGELLRDLQHPDSRVRRAAVVALGRIQDPAAAQPLLPLLADPDSSISEQAAFALGQLQGLDEKSRLAVQSALLDKIHDLPLRRTAVYVEALGKKGDAAIVPVIANMLATGFMSGMGSEARPPLVEGMAALALGRIHSAQAIDGLSQVGDLGNRDVTAAWRIGAGLAASPDTSLYQPTLSLLAHPHKYARAMGAWALGRQGNRRAVQKLLLSLSDLDWEVRASALGALGRLHDREAASYCEALAADAHPLVREAALVALDSLHSIPHVPLVREALHDPVPAVRLAALRALAPVEKARARDAFLAVRADSVEFVRAEVLEVAHHVLGEDETVKLLLESLRDASVPVRTHAVVALGELPAPVMRGARRDAVRRGLEAALRDADFVVAAVAAEAVGKLALVESAPALVVAYDAHAATHHDVDVRLAAVEATSALAKTKAPAVGQSLRPFLTRALGDADPRVAHAASVTLALLDGKPEPPAGLPQAGVVAQFDSLPAIDLGTVRVRLVTRHGETVLALDGDRFPRTVGSFLRLVDSGFYKDGVFHRVVPAFVVQGGDPRGDGWGDAGWFLPCEYGDLRYDDAGVVGMAHAGKDTGGSQFFITHLPVPRLDGRYTAFGRVERGMSVVDQIVRGDRFKIERLEPQSAP